MSQKVGHYRILKEIGRGAQGQVFLAEDERLSRRVALKVLASTLAPSAATLGRFQREAEAASRLDHPGICSVYEAGEADGVQYIAMRYIEGETLARQIQTTRAPAPLAGSETVLVDEPTPEPGPVAEPNVPGEKPRPGAKVTPSSRVTREEIIRVLHLIERAARAVHAAHEAGLIHRDIKPGNIMVTKDGEPIILDFGLARDEESEVQTLTHSGDLLGTPAYMSPEQLLAQRIQLDRRTDVYSLGVTLFECLTLERPFDSPTREGLYQKILTAPVPDPTRLNRLIPRDLKVVLETAMEKDRDRRYKTALDFAEDLRRVRSYEPIHARPAGPVLRFRRWTQRNPVLATSTLGLFLLLSTGLGISLVLLQRLDGERRQTAAEAAQKDVALRERAEALKTLQLESDAKAKALLERQEALNRAEGLRLTAQASSTVSQNPGLALLLALEAAERGAGPLLNSTIVEILRSDREERVLQAPNGAGGATFFSPGGDRALMTAWGGSGGARVWDTATGTLLAILRGPSDGISAAAFSPDGEQIITASSYRPEASIWSATTGEMLRSLNGHRYSIVSIAFRADGERVVTASEDGTARVWDVRTGQGLTVLKGSECGLRFAVFSANGKWILGASSGYTYEIVYDASGRTPQKITRGFGAGTTARLWDAETGAPLHVLRGHQGAVAATLSPDDRAILTSSGFGTRAGVRIWDAATGQKIARLDVPGDRCTFAAFSPDSSRVLTIENHVEPSPGASAETRMQSRSMCLAHVWDAATGRRLSVLEGHSIAIVSAAFSSDGERIVTASEDATARIWKADTGALLATLKGHEASLLTAAFSPDGKHVFTSSSDRTARVWNAETTRELAVVAIQPDKPVRFARFSPDGRHVFTALPEGGAVWDSATGKRLALIGRAASSSSWLSKMGLGSAAFATVFDRAEFSPDGRKLLTQAGGKFAVWGGDEWNVLAEWKSRNAYDLGVRPCLAFSPDGNTAVTSQFVAEPSSVIPSLIGAAAKGKAPELAFEAVFWDAATGKALRALRGPDDAIIGEPITSISFSADGRRAVTRSQDSKAIVWDTATGAVLARVDRSQAGITSIVISPDGSRLAATTWSFDARVLDASTGAQVATLSGHTASIESVAFSPDGQRVLTAAEDNTARIWDAATGEPILVLEGHRAPLHGGSFSPDGRQVVTFASDQAVRVWDSTTGREIMSLPHGELAESAAFTLDSSKLMTITTSGVLRLWPLDLVTEARRRKARDLTPREMDRYEIGTPEKRKAGRREAELTDILIELEVSMRPSPGKADEAPRTPSIDGALARLKLVLASQPSKEELAHVEEALLAAATRTRRRSPQLLEALSDVQSRGGRARDAIRTLEEAAALPDAPRTLLTSLEARRAAVLPDLVSYASIDAALTGQLVLIPAGAEWRFFRGRSEPSPEMQWTERAFDDSGWEKGPSGFGYGDDDDATVLSDMQQSYTTVYIRRAFQGADAARFASLTLSILVDDGFVAYLNGIEVARSLAGSSGTRVPFDGVADREAVEPLAPLEYSIDTKLLQPDGNVLAVQGLNRSLRSSDLSLLPVLRAELKPDLSEDSKRFDSFRAQASGGDASTRLAYLGARILQRAGRHADAAMALSKLAETDKGAPEPVLRLAESLRAASDPRAAAVRLFDALSGPPGREKTLWSLWLEMSLVDLKAQPASLLARWPEGVAAGGASAGDDLRWLLEQLVETGAVRIHCGGGDYKSASGALWGRDRFFVGGVANRGTYKAPIGKTDDDPIYQTHRWFPADTGFNGYRIPLPPGRYEVALHFAEVSRSTPRLRAFDILLEGKTVLEAYDMVREAGINTADVRTFDVAVDDGALEIELAHGASNPEISGIEVRRK